MELKPYDEFGVEFDIHFAEHLKRSDLSIIGLKNAISTKFRTEVSPDRKTCKQWMTFPLYWDEVVADLRMAVYSAFDLEWVHVDNSRFYLQPAPVEWFLVLDEAMCRASKKDLPDTRYIGACLSCEFDAFIKRHPEDFSLPENFSDDIIREIRSFRLKMNSIVL